MARQIRLSDLHQASTASASSPAHNQPSAASSYYSSAALVNRGNSTALAVGDRIPGLRASTAFLSSLRANLHLSSTSAPHSFSEPDSLSASVTNTPDSLRPSTTNHNNMTSSTGSLSHLAPNADPVPAPDSSDPLADIPPLTTSSASTTEDKIAGLKLVADSVAQQRQLASRYLVFHPLIIAAWIALLAVVAQLLYKGQRSDLAIVGTTWAGCVMAGLVAARMATGGYIDMAEKVGTWTWLDKDRDTSEEDEILITRFGDEIIGALVMRREQQLSSPPAAGTRSSKKKSTAAGLKMRGVIRAWTVKVRYRGKGVGSGLLEEAVRSCMEKGLEGPVFADEHANSGRILPGKFNAGFERREKWARGFLEGIIAEEGGGDGGGKGGKGSKKQR